MGGRGSSFAAGVGKGITNLAERDVIEVFKNDVPVPEDKQTPIMRKLVKQNIVVYESMLKVPAKILNANLKAIYDSYKFTKKHINILNEDNPLQLRLAKFSSPRTLACCGINKIDFSNPQILFNSSLTKKKPKEIIESVTKNQETNWWVQTDKKNKLILVPTHEYGHFLHYNIIRLEVEKHYEDEYKKLVTRAKNNDIVIKYELNKMFEEISDKVINKICLQCEKDYGKITESDMSRYGVETKAEFFAEAFANAKLAKDPTKVGKTLLKYLKGE